MSLTVLYKWGEYVYLAAIIFVENHSDDFVLSVLYHRVAVHITACLPHSCKKETKEIIYFGGCAYGTPRILVDGLLFDAYHWTQPSDFIYIRPFQRAEHIACVGGKRVYVSALPFGKDSVESQR